ncbi:MAG: hypothetical protein V1729_05635 [Candidatus Woesearchaeota archaeon]
MPYPEQEERVSSLKKGIGLLEWDLQSMTNEEIRKRKLLYLEMLRSELKTLRKEDYPNH